MLKITATLTGVAPISFSGPISSKKETGESHDAFEERTWRERLHVDEKDNVFLPPNFIKNMLAGCAKYLSETVPGKGKATYTKHFEAGILVTEPMAMGIKGKDVQGERMFVPSDGRRGGTTRVWKTFPIIPAWEIVTTIYVLDPLLVDRPEKIEEYLKYSGKFIGLGRFRPRNNGFYGRFEVTDFSHEKVE